MTDDEQDGLQVSADARALLDLYARERRPPPARRVDNLDGVLRSLRSGARDVAPEIGDELDELELDAEPTGRDEPSDTSRARRPVALAVLAVAAAAAAALWISSLGPARSWTLGRRVVDHAASRTGPSATPERGRVVNPQRPPASATVHHATPEPARPPRPSAPPRRAAPTTIVDDARATAKAPRVEPDAALRLRRESALIRRARAELDRGAHEAALALLAEHEREFPEGVLTEERLALAAISNCSIGQLARGREHARALARRNPRSSQLLGARRSCQLSVTGSPAPAE